MTMKEGCEREGQGKEEGKVGDGRKREVSGGKRGESQWRIER